MRRGIAAIATYLFLSVFNAAAWVMFTAGVILFLAMYLTAAAPLIGAINQIDVNSTSEPCSLTWE